MQSNAIGLLEEEIVGDTWNIPGFSKIKSLRSHTITTTNHLLNFYAVITSRTNRVKIELYKTSTTTPYKIDIHVTLKTGDQTLASKKVKSFNSVVDFGSQLSLVRKVAHDELNVVFEASFVFLIEHEHNPPPKVTPSASLLLEAEDKDFSFEIQNEPSVQMHSCFIMERSSYFKRTLQQEQLTYTFPVPEKFSYNVIKAFEEFTYTQDILELSEGLATTVMPFANEYEVGELVTYLEHYLRQKLDIDNVLTLFRVSIDNNAITLRNAAVQLIKDNRDRLEDRINYFKINFKRHYEELVKLW